MTQKQTATSRSDKSTDHSKHAAAPGKSPAPGRSHEDMDETDDRPAKDSKDESTRGSGGKFAKDSPRASNEGSKGGKTSHTR